MRIPDSLASLAEYGIIEEVLRPLMSGKEAQIYLVISGGQQRVAKVYKEAQNRTFKNRADYTEGRKVRNTRDQRAMGKNSRHGRAQIEAAWRATEVDMIYRLRDAGVRVPVPYHFIDSVLVMEMITDADGNPAPRLGDLSLELPEAQAIFERLLAEVVRMLSAGVVHGDLSDFNVLVGTDGPVVIDFPQSVDASSNQNARKLLLRDVDNLHRFMARFDPNYRALPYAQEMWALYERSALAPDAKLSGRHRPSEQKANTNAVLELIGDANYDERRRRQQLGLKTRGGPNAPRPQHERPAEPQPGSSRALHESGADMPSTPVPQRRVEVVMTPPSRRNSGQGHRAQSGQDTRQHQAAPRSTDPRARPQQDNRPAPNAARNSDQRARPQQDNRPAPNAARGSDQRARPTNEGRTQHTERAAFAGERSARTSGGDGSNARAPQPMNASVGAAGAAGEGAQKRRRRRRRRKPNADAPKTPT